MIQPRYICDCCLRETCGISFRHWCVGCELQFSLVAKLWPYLAVKISGAFLGC